MELNKLHQVWCLHARHVSNLLLAAGTVWETVAHHVTIAS